jgi:hypothetical protein
MEGTCVCCGLPLAIGDMYCGGCGQPVEDAATSTAPARDSWMSYQSSPVPADIAELERTPDTEYLSRRLEYDQEGEAPFDPLGNSRLLAQFARHAAQYLMVYLFGALAAAIALLILHAMGLPAATALAIGTIGAVAAAILLGCLFWLLPVPALLSEWKFSLDDMAAAGPAAFEHIAWAIRRHETPLDVIQVRRLRLAGGESRDYLEIRRDLFTGFISCFRYGQDLYLGWTFWLRISPLRYLLMGLARSWQTLLRRGTELQTTLRFDYARAMREAMHSVAREGADVAAGQAPPQGQGTLGASVPVTVSEVDS